jgi:hypothetical protein
MIWNDIWATVPEMSPQLVWVNELIASVNRATGGQIKSVQPIVNADPLRVFVKLELHEDWSGRDYQPFCILAHGFARANNCVLEWVHVGDSTLTMEVVLKRRLGPTMNNNPLLPKKV